MSAAVTLVAVIDCHTSHNVRLENVRPEEKGYIKRFLKSRGYRVVERKPKPEPVCDNCANMTLRATGSGTHRHRDLLNLHIPDDEPSATCAFHTAVTKFESSFESGKARLQNTFRTKGGAI